MIPLEGTIDADIAAPGGKQTSQLLESLRNDDLSRANLRGVTGKPFLAAPTLTFRFSDDRATVPTKIAHGGQLRIRLGAQCSIIDAENAKPAVSCEVLGSRCEHPVSGNREGVRGWRRGTETTASQHVRTARRSLA